jgi:hypothetical protein
MNLPLPKVTDDRRGWHIDKGISITTILSLIVALTSLMLWALSVEKRVELNQYILKEMAETQKGLVAREASRHERERDNLKEIMRQLRELKR